MSEIECQVNVHCVFHKCCLVLKCATFTKSQIILDIVLSKSLNNANDKSVKMYIYILISSKYHNYSLMWLCLMTLFYRASYIINDSIFL